MYFGEEEEEVEERWKKRSELSKMRAVYKEEVHLGRAFFTFCPSLGVSVSVSVSISISSSSPFSASISGPKNWRAARRPHSKKRGLGSTNRSHFSPSRLLSYMPARSEE